MGLGWLTIHVGHTKTTTRTESCLKGRHKPKMTRRPSSLGLFGGHGSWAENRQKTLVWAPSARGQNAVWTRFGCQNGPLLNSFASFGEPKQVTTGATRTVISVGNPHTDVLYCCWCRTPRKTMHSSSPSATPLAALALGVKHTVYEPVQFPRRALEALSGGEMAWDCLALPCTWGYRQWQSHGSRSAGLGNGTPSG